MAWFERESPYNSVFKHELHYLHTHATCTCVRMMIELRMNILALFSNTVGGNYMSLLMPRVYIDSVKCTGNSHETIYLDTQV